MNGTIYWWMATPLKSKTAIYFESDCDNASRVAKTACAGQMCNCTRLDERPANLLHQLTVTAHFSASANPALSETREIPIFSEGKL